MKACSTHSIIIFLEETMSRKCVHNTEYVNKVIKIHYIAA